MKSLDASLEAAVNEIRTNHHKIIDDWCKAYLAQLHGLGIDIRPGCFTLNQMPFNEGMQVGYKYWFTLEEHTMKSLERTLDENFESNIRDLFDECCKIFFEESLDDAEFEFCQSIIQLTATFLQARRKRRTKTT